jgi:hypothetical protein
MHNNFLDIVLIIKPRLLTNILQTFGQTFLKHPKYQINMFVECLIGINMYPNNFVCQCPK